MPAGGAATASSHGLIGTLLPRFPQPDTAALHWRGCSQGLMRDNCMDGVSLSLSLSLSLFFSLSVDMTCVAGNLITAVMKGETG